MKHKAKKIIEAIFFQIHGSVSVIILLFLNNKNIKEFIISKSNVQMFWQEK